MRITWGSVKCMNEKSILVIDTPSICRECPLFDRDYVWCVPLNDATVDDDVLDNCPLRPCPEKKPTKDTDKNIIYGKNADAINRGWNACLKAVTGETE